MAKKLLILTGPQGSGNHLWSKIFALHPDVHGWGNLLNEYWIGHDQEPFVEYWRSPDQLKQFNWAQSDHYVTSISVPFMDNGVAVVPDIVRFAACALGTGLQVNIAIIGRDRNIIEYQETRVRGVPTFETAQKEYAKLASWNPVYLSYELLHLYGTDYLRQLSNQLEFPIAHSDTRLKEILTVDTNSKYFQAAGRHVTDDLARHASRKHT